MRRDSIDGAGGSAGQYKSNDDDVDEMRKENETNSDYLMVYIISYDFVVLCSAHAQM